MPDNKRIKLLNKLEKVLGIKFSEIKLLSQALTHKSFKANESSVIFDNERLEFLGDAVLKLLVADYLFKRYPEQQEGELSKKQAMFVSDKMLAKKAGDLDLGSYMQLGINEERQDVSGLDSTLANAMEALFGAYYLDQGIEKCKKVVLGLLQKSLDQEEDLDYLKDYKTILQEINQEQGLGTPEYRVIEESGPSHNKTFTIEVTILLNGKQLTAIATGKTKKKAEQTVAREIYNKLQAET